MACLSANFEPNNTRWFACWTIISWWNGRSDPSDRPSIGRELCETNRTARLTLSFRRCAHRRPHSRMPASTDAELLQEPCRADHSTVWLQAVFVPRPLSRPHWSSAAPMHKELWARGVAGEGGRLRRISKRRRNRQLKPLRCTDGPHDEHTKLSMCDSIGRDEAPQAAPERGRLVSSLMPAPRREEPSDKLARRTTPTATGAPTRVWRCRWTMRPSPAAGA